MWRWVLLIIIKIKCVDEPRLSEAIIACPFRFHVVVVFIQAFYILSMKKLDIDSMLNMKGVLK